MRLISVGQLTRDTAVTLDRPLALGDQTTGTLRRAPGGTAAIVALNAAALNRCPVAFAGHVGAADVLSELRAAGVAIDALVRTAATPEVLILVHPDGERTMVGATGRPPWQWLRPCFTPGDLAFFEGWHLFAPSGYERLLMAARHVGATVALDVCSAARASDPRVHARRLAALAPDILLANAAEAAILGLEPAPPAQLLVVHAGTAPTRVWRGDELTEVPVRAVRALDTTGAGDTFAAGLLSALAAGDDVPAAVEAAHVAAAAVVRTHGPLLMSHAGRAAAVELA